MRNPMVAVLLALASLWALPATAQRKLEVPATAGWRHAETGVTLRAQIAGLPRTELTDSTANELDVAAQYGSATDIAVTLYLFRPGVQSAALWFDRAEAQILLRDSFGGATPQGAPRAFAAPGSTVASALRASYVPAKGPVKSTALAMVPLGEWLVAIRISAVSLDVAALDARLDAVIDGIGWPTPSPAAQAAVPIAACPTPALAYARRAKLKKPSIADALIGATLAGMKPDPKEAEAARPVTWCREGAGLARYGVYRPSDSTNTYFLALGDAGRAIQVAPGLALDEKPGFMVSLIDLDKTLIYPQFDALPRPDQAIDAVSKGSATSSVSRDGKDMTIRGD